mmetsp:Transcript_25664/g.60875  ORF Transcript_25664/g.60875 Transcript_25664/m.60875 type:complete len:268 (-) Transcript_25664:305-1108(-)
MRTRNDIRGYAWSELFDAIQSHLAADALKEERTDDVVSSNTTPHKRKAVESDGAAVFYTLAQVQAVYLLGQQNTGGPSKSFTPGQPKGGEKAPLINTDPKATCPKCKIHHPGGLHTCLSYQESKQILKTKYANRKFQSKKSKGAKQQDKTPEQQLPSMDVPVFLVDAIEPSESTKSMGAELFGTFSKNPPGIWSVRVQDGVEIDELSDGPPDLIASSSEDEDNEVKPVIFPTTQPIKVEYVTEKGRTVMMLAWILTTCLRLGSCNQR